MVEPNATAQKPDPWGLTPEEAGAKLAELEAQFRGPTPTATPTNAKEAAARLRAITADSKWNERYRNGAVAERREFACLTELAASGGALDAHEDAIVTVDSITDPHALPPTAYNGLIDGLREQGLPDSAERYIRDLDSGARTDRPTQGDGFVCREVLDRLIKSADWRAAVLRGDPQANNLKNTLDRIIAYSADDGQPVSGTVRQRLAALGLR
jgi:hypothetical protein